MRDKLENDSVGSSERGSQAAVLPYRFENGTLRFLLITSLGTKRWILPKGNIEMGETAVEAATREAYEEAGIKGEIELRAVGSYEYESSSKRHIVRAFAMKVETLEVNWPEKKERQRKWFSATKAADNIKEEQLKHIIVEFCRKHRTL